MKNGATYNGKTYDVVHVCDLIHSNGAKVLGEYQSDFYAGMPALTVNSYGKGNAYYVAFRNDDDFASDFCNGLIESIGIAPDCGIKTGKNVAVRKRGDYIFVMNFSDEETTVELDREYLNVVTGEKISLTAILPVCGYLILE